MDNNNGVLCLNTKSEDISQGMVVIRADNDAQVTIKKLTCGKYQVCVLYSNGKSICLGGGSFNESNLTKEMKTEVRDI